MPSGANLTQFMFYPKINKTLVGLAKIVALEIGVTNFKNYYFYSNLVLRFWCLVMEIKATNWQVTFPFQSVIKMLGSSMK